MADTKLSDLTAASTLDGTEIVYGVQSAGNVKITTAQIKTYAGGASTFDQIGSGTNTTATMAVGTGASLSASGSGTITATAAPLSGVSGLGANVATFLATPTSANLAAAVTNETGSGALVFATSPALTTPDLGTPTALVGTNITGTAAALNIGGTAPAGTLTGATLAAGVTASSLTSVGTLTTLAIAGTETITSASATSFSVGLNGATNPSFVVDNSTASQAGGISVQGGAAAGTTTVAAISSGSNQNLTISSLGTGNLVMRGTGASTTIAAGASTQVTIGTSQTSFTNSVRNSTTNTAHLFTGLASGTGGSSLTAGSEVHSFFLNYAATQTHASNTAIALQRDVRITPSTHAGQTATVVITDAVAFEVTGPPIAGTNCTITNAWAARFVGDVTLTAGALKGTRINPRVVTLVDAATVTPNSDTTDQGILTTLSQSTTLANPTGTPVDGQKLIIRVKSTVARTWTFGAQYRGSVDLALPAATSGGSLTDYMAFIWNAADSKWDHLAKCAGF